MCHQTQLTVSGANGVHGRHVRRRHRVSGEVLDQGVVGQDDDVEDVHEDVGHNDGVVLEKMTVLVTMLMKLIKTVVT